MRFLSRPVMQVIQAVVRQYRSPKLLEHSPLLHTCNGGGHVITLPNWWNACPFSTLSTRLLHFFCSTIQKISAGSHTFCTTSFQHVGCVFHVSQSPMTTLFDYLVCRPGCFERRLDLTQSLIQEIRETPPEASIRYPRVCCKFCQL